VPLAATLSGGMDSSSIVALAAREAAKPETIQTFSVIPPQTVDESFWIDRTVAKTGVMHAYLQPDWSQMGSIFDAVLAVHDEPFQSSSAIYQYLLRREVAARGIKVLLVGEGGDEVLGGYRRLFFPYLYALQQDGRDDLMERALTGASAFLGIDRASAFAQLNVYRATITSGGSGQENESAYGLLDDDVIALHREVTEAPAYPPLRDGGSNRFMAHLVEHLTRRDIPYVLRMEDRNSMAHGIEARVPFLDHCFLEKTFSYDYAEFMKDGQNKSKLRRAMTGLLPDEVIGRRGKSPRPGSNVYFMYDLLRDRMKDLLTSREFSDLHWWQANAAEQFEHDCAARDAQRAEVWFRVYSVARWSALNA
jgi:asparagine synthase (glutamine-hydrolysing)